MRDAYGMNIICCTPEQVRYPINIASTEPIVRQKTIDYLLRGIEAAEALGAGMVQIVPGVRLL